ncbi:MAG: DUF2007 domain-containing protein [Capnocytophaga sp.]|nr:DUF2007 domain-containing protein [Capnocytophaga sp.]
MLETKIKKIFEGSLMEANLIKAALSEAGIEPIERNRSESARLAGFAGEVFMQLELFVFEDQYDKAMEIINALEE